MVAEEVLMGRNQEDQVQLLQLLDGQVLEDLREVPVLEARQIIQAPEEQVQTVMVQILEVQVLQEELVELVDK